MTGFLLRVAAVERLSLSLTNEYKRLTQDNHKALVPRATAVAARLRRRRASSARSSPSTPLQKRRVALQAYRSLSTDSLLLSPVRKIVHRRLAMASHQEIRRRSSAADKTPHVETLGTPENVATTTTFATAPDIPKGHERRHRSTASLSGASIMDDLAKYNNDNEMMPPPGRPMSQEFSTPTRGSRSASVVSRHTKNRLSITLPIAPPTPDPSRPTPTSSVLPSIPATPIEDATAETPSNASEFIIAIAAQERRVLELKEELARAEADLSSLKKQWASQDVTVHRRSDSRTFGPKLPVAVSEPESLQSRNSMDLDRKKIFMQNQSTPTSNRRRVLRGGHTRTLSLLSPPKSTSSFAVLEDDEKSSRRMIPLERRNTTQADPQVSKRTSWQPRLPQNAAGMPALVEDFKLGLRAFVEDIRQITVGDEPIKGPVQTAAPTQLAIQQELQNQPLGDTDTIRPPPPAARGSASTVFGSPSATVPSPTASSKARDLTKDKIKSGKGKYFSWTPLGLDALGDNDWSNWESPTSTKSVRWSGSTMSNGEDDVEKEAERSTSSKRPMSFIEGPLLSPKLEEILPNVVNRFTPSNLKRTANNLMDEWERSLVAPESANKENAAQ